MRWTWQEYRTQPRWYVNGVYRRLTERASAQRKAAAEKPRARR